MNLTKNTTEEEILAPVKAARERLASLAALDDIGNIERLLDAAHEIWAATTVAQFRFKMVKYLQHFANYPSSERDKALRNLFITTLARGADDSWSGRKNDARRFAFDAVRAEIAHLRWDLAELSGGN